ncbi:T6SS immunity protein Tli4 family protein [Paraburkholderia sp.]|uniref:T6SS immunity protein Tli4 family protein n=1 Tax=Paraburkholderia sp. TaxID=1926495 RepID=UPI0025D3FCD5|nr:T6SS immunity protein Tli4 family protein [Paraburkholderia sp.]
MNQGWRTRAIGRHLVDLPGDATTIETYSVNQTSIALLPDITTQGSFDLVVNERERERRAARHDTHGSMFVERVRHPNGAITLVSWDSDYSILQYHFDSYYRAGTRVLKYSGTVDDDRKKLILDFRESLSHKWREIPSGELPEGIGFVAGDVMLASKSFNPERWELNIRLRNKPDAWFRLTSYVHERDEPEGLRARAGGVLPALLGMVVGVGQLRNRARPVGPIKADEILVAGTQDGKRTYGFKWEAPGKAYSLAEPNLNLSLRVGESAYTTNRESFANDGEALELWDGVVESIRLRPGAV